MPKMAQQRACELIDRLARVHSLEPAEYEELVRAFSPEVAA